MITLAAMFPLHECWEVEWEAGNKPYPNLIIKTILGQPARQADKQTWGGGRGEGERREREREKEGERGRE